MALIKKLCKQALVYVSTAYSQCPHSEIEEKIYPMDLDLPVEEEVMDGKLGRNTGKWNTEEKLLIEKYYSGYIYKSVLFLCYIYML
jgi:hypothetical protein